MEVKQSDIAPGDYIFSVGIGSPPRSCEVARRSTLVRLLPYLVLQ